MMNWRGFIWYWDLPYRQENDARPFCHLRSCLDYSSVQVISKLDFTY